MLHLNPTPPSRAELIRRFAPPIVTGLALGAAILGCFAGIYLGIWAALS